MGPSDGMQLEDRILETKARMVTMTEPRSSSPGTRDEGRGSVETRAELGAKGNEKI